jgi:hypothetical protein
MDPATAWHTRLKELRVAVQLPCELLADRTVPVAEREHAAAAFAVLWPRFCAHVRTMPV